WTLMASGLVQGGTNLLGRGRSDHLGTETFTDVLEPHLEVIAREPPLLVVAAIPEIVPELFAEFHHLETTDHLETVVFRNHVGHFETFLGRGKDLRGVHEERTVPDEYRDALFFLGIRQPHPDTGRNLVPHARETEFEVC